MREGRTRGGSLAVIVTVGALACAGQAHARQYIVKDGEPMAEIVVPETPCSSVRYAARELQHYIEKISGATLPIFPPTALGSEPQSTHLLAKYPKDLERKPVKIYVGESWHTDQLGVTDDGLEWGAYRMKSGDGWLALLGKDTDFTPMGIWGRNRGDMNTRAQEEWEKAIGDHHWVNPMAKIWIRYNGELDLWAFDQKGTVNAVCGFLRGLGVRWYMPGELGEIVPELKTIELPEVDETVIPDVKIRDLMWAKYGLTGAEDDMIWSMRQGANTGYGFRGAHGLSNVTRPEENRTNHPEWYALYNGKRDVESGTPNPCLSSEGLFEENLKYIRFVFDMFDVPAVCVGPDDGFTTMCQCDKCKGKDTPERGRQGVLSDYVWDYVNRIAKEIYKTHPDKLILGCAYSTYWLPPEHIDQLSPNVALHVVNARRRYNIPAEEALARREAVTEWARLSGNKIITFQNEGGGRNTPRIFAEDIHALKGLIMGEEMHGPYQGGHLANPGFTHLHFYVCTRLWWDMDQDVDVLLDEYYKNYYGPAADEMEAFIEYYERNQQDMRGINGAPAIKKALDLFARAEKKVDPESVCGKRVALFSKGLDGKRKWYTQIKDGRKDPPVFRLAEVSGEIKVDGQLDESFWKDLPGELKEIEAGGAVEHPTRFKIGIKDNALYFGVKCMDEPGHPANTANVDKNDDGGLWFGDVVEFLVETPTHSYYQIAVGPDARMCDLDRSRRIDFTWGAEADVATAVNEEAGYWTIEMRVPFTSSEQDPLHEIVGPDPSADNPWFFNICRQRVRDEGGEKSAFSPTGTEGFHEILKFGKLLPE